MVKTRCGVEGSLMSRVVTHTTTPHHLENGTSRCARASTCSTSSGCTASWPCSWTWRGGSSAACACRQQRMGSRRRLDVWAARLPRLASQPASALHLRARPPRRSVAPVWALVFSCVALAAINFHCVALNVNELVLEL